MLVEFCQSTRGAILTSAQLQGANLQGADLSKANLLGANLQGAQLNNIDFDDIEEPRSKLLKNTNPRSKLISATYVSPIARLPNSQYVIAP